MTHRMTVIFVLMDCHGRPPNSKQFVGIQKCVPPTSSCIKNSHIELKNYLDFTDAAEAISIHYQITEDFSVVQEGQIDDLKIAPKSTALYLYHCQQ